MTDRGVSDYDMPDRTWPPSVDMSGIPEASLAALLEGATPAADATAPLQHVADVLAALRAEPAGDEAAGHNAAIAEFRSRVGVSSRPGHSHRRKPGPFMLPALTRSRVGTAAIAAVVGLGGMAAAAYAGALPAVAQQAAHDVIGAPGSAPKPQASRTNPATVQPGTPVGPNPSGHPSFGLCTAYLDGKERGSHAEKPAAFRNLETAAGGAGNVRAYCAGVPHPGAAQSAARHRGGEPESGTRTHPTGEPPRP
jgi:hypothetical protein